MTERGKLVAVTGGIGSGKSIVSKVLSTMGFHVYDCDSSARYIMDRSRAIKQRIAAEIAADAILFDSSDVWENAAIDRKRLAEIVFNDAEKLGLLNSIVHGAVKEDLRMWQRAHTQINNPGAPLFVETAILHASGLDEMVDAIWHVRAPEDIALSRAVKRDNTSAEAVLRRIENQKGEEAALTAHRPEIRFHTIVNDGIMPVLPQIISGLKQIV